MAAGPRTLELLMRRAEVSEWVRADVFLRMLEGEREQTVTGWIQTPLVARLPTPEEIEDTDWLCAAGCGTVVERDGLDCSVCARRRCREAAKVRKTRASRKTAARGRPRLCPHPDEMWRTRASGRRWCPLCEAERAARRRRVSA